MINFRVEGFVGEDDATAQALAGRLAFFAGEPFGLLINSLGGDAFEGAAMLAELRAHAGHVTVHVRGVAASAASLVAMGGDTILMDPSAVLMIHDPSALTIGTAAEHDQTAATLRTLANTYAEAYASRSGNRVSDVLEWMAAETWLTAPEAVALGFADGIEEAAEAPLSRDVEARARALWAAARPRLSSIGACHVAA